MNCDCTTGRKFTGKDDGALAKTDMEVASAENNTLRTEVAIGYSHQSTPVTGVANAWKVVRSSLAVGKTSATNSKTAGLSGSPAARTPSTPILKWV